jgi:hypothetical protein
MRTGQPHVGLVLGLGVLTALVVVWQIVNRSSSSSERPAVSTAPAKRAKADPIALASTNGTRCVRLGVARGEVGSVGVPDPSTAATACTERNSQTSYYCNDRAAAQGIDPCGAFVGDAMAVYNRAATREASRLERSGVIPP